MVYYVSVKQMMLKLFPSTFLSKVFLDSVKHASHRQTERKTKEELRTLSSLDKIHREGQLQQTKLSPRLCVCVASIFSVAHLCQRVELIISLQTSATH